MFRLTKEFTFEASHRLPNHVGKCKRLHGHSWRMAVTFEGNTLQTAGSQRGMLVDYGVIKGFVQPLVEDLLDHHHLNDTTALEDPTSEMLAMWMFHRIHDELPPDLRPMLAEVRIDETCTASCVYRRPS